MKLSKILICGLITSILTACSGHSYTSHSDVTRSVAVCEPNNRLKKIQTNTDEWGNTVYAICNNNLKIQLPKENTQ